MTPPLELARATADELRALPRGTTVIFLPVGGLEDRGPGLPIGLDLEVALALARRAGARLEAELPGWRAVIAPSIPLAVELVTDELAPATRGYVLRDCLVDTTRGWIRAGFRHFVVFSGTMTPRQLTAIEEAAKLVQLGEGFFLRGWRRLRMLHGTWTGRPTLISASSALVDWPAVRASPISANPAEHGGGRDWSVALALGLVAPETRPAAAREVPPRRRWIDRLPALARRLGRPRRTGHWGDPAKGTREIGERALAQSLDAIFPKLRAVWEGSNPNLLFRSYYSLFPPNFSTWRIWLLSAALSATLLAWVWLTLETLVP